MKLRPFSGLCLCEPIKQSEVTKGGIFIPETSQHDLKSQFKVVESGKGRIVKLKNGKHLRLMQEVKPGDVVVANSYAGRPVECNGVSMRLIHHDNIMAVVEESSV